MSISKPNLVIDKDAHEQVGKLAPQAAELGAKISELEAKYTAGERALVEAKTRREVTAKAFHLGDATAQEKRRAERAVLDAEDALRGIKPAIGELSTRRQKIVAELNVARERAYLRPFRTFVQAEPAWLQHIARERRESAVRMVLERDPGARGLLMGEFARLQALESALSEAWREVPVPAVSQTLPDGRVVAASSPEAKEQQKRARREYAERLAEDGPGGREPFFRRQISQGVPIPPTRIAK